jgi:outer membrane receptor protein involved in Fe transport
VLEDGFSVTQPDGLSRTDLIDPHAYGAVDIYRGPSSAMFGNYATGGAINFRLWVALLVAGSGAPDAPRESSRRSCRLTIALSVPIDWRWFRVMQAPC